MNNLVVVLPQLAMEVDGPYHFTHNTQQPMGHTLIRCAHSGSDDHVIESKCVSTDVRFDDHVIEF